jgi:redox-sensitive bicupin YhaK (pirin superfamily)
MSQLVSRFFPLGFQWQTLDPFLFCVHHDDAYPKGNGALGPVGSLAGRQLGSDFQPRDGWRMYHGQRIPGFPRHPHRGFETITIVRRGLVDHSDSLGATARYGRGDVQWLTAGSGIQHSEMFPLVHTDRDNPLELFQIWLNLPAASKFVAPHFTMFWADQIPTVELGPGATASVIAGPLGGAAPLSPPPDSYGSDPNGGVHVWLLRLQPGATATLPVAAPGVQRVAYVFAGGDLRIHKGQVPARHGVALNTQVELPLTATDTETEVLILGGRPIAEPLVQHGPFVMNSADEINQAIADYRRTGFGGWSWADDAPVHADLDRFARRADGTVETPND